ncbi:MAG: thioredoxin family protein [Proteobacteria bacterium]|nr:thioredoxin family protein [Pseudomonadota bacterium]
MRNITPHPTPGPSLKGRGVLLFLALLLFPIPTFAASLDGGLDKPYAAPDIASKGPWLNSDPLTIHDLKGKVALVDFWTYSCINCLRTLPYLKAWQERYKDQGFIIIGVHSPEFDFEKNTTNVEKAINRFHITYPVVQDNDRFIWDRFGNEYWPAHYLIDRQGRVVYTHFGEGEYDRTEHNIRALLETNAPLAKLEEEPARAAYHQSLETYLGSERGERAQLIPTGAPDTYKFPEELSHDYWSLQGKWKRADQYVEAQSSAAGLRLRFRGGKVFLVLGTADGQPVHARIFYDGKLVGDKAGKDVKDGFVEIKEHRLYELFDRKSKSIFGSDEGIIEIETERPGLQAYAFTFGA